MGIAAEFEVDEQDLISSSKRGRPQGGDLEERMMKLEEGEGFFMENKSRPHAYVVIRRLRFFNAFFTTQIDQYDRQRFKLIRISKETYEKINTRVKNK